MTRIPCSSMRIVLFLLMHTVCVFSMNHSWARGEGPHWDLLAPIPNGLGVAGPIVGVAAGKLVVGGGANFPDGPPWEGHPKVWHDEVFVLDSPTSTWRNRETLPCPLGYAVCMNWQEGFLSLGGSNSEGHLRACYHFQLAGNQLKWTQLPDLPEPLAMACGAIIDKQIYLAGGQTSPDSHHASSHFWKLNLAEPQAVWESLPTWPGPPRLLAVAGVLDREFYLFSGAELVTQSDGTPGRRYLKDALRFHPDTGWERLPDLPYSVAAAPSPAWLAGETLNIAGGDDGQHFAQNAQLSDRHPGFSRRILCYDRTRNEWNIQGELPAQLPQLNADRSPTVFPPVTTMATRWHGDLVIPSGEIRPGVRTPEVLRLKFKRD